MNFARGPIAVDNTATHSNHCCKKHGCKYEATGKNCPVYSGTTEQEFPCEVCELARAQEADILAEFAEWFEAAEYFVTDNPYTWTPIGEVIQAFLRRPL